MINLLVDESYAFDYLAILQVKYDNKKESRNEQNLLACQEYLKKQVGENLFNVIINSTQYKDLLFTNRRTFDAVEKARYGNITAKEVDNLNQERYYNKIRLQQYFFGNTVLETKT